MENDFYTSILRAVADHSMTVEQALLAFRDLPYKDLDFAKLDHHRALRTGIDEVIFGQGKTPEQVVEILEGFLERQGSAIITRVNPAIIHAVLNIFPEAHVFETARIIAVGESKQIDLESPYVAIVSAGTSDMPIAEEAAVTLELHAMHVERVYDVGVAGLHRLLDRRQTLWGASAVIAVAGMEGALATVIGGLVSVPVIAVPTSVGYGSSFNGLAALLAMLNSCAPGVSVVNIDNGFGAAICAYMITRSRKCE